MPWKAIRPKLTTCMGTKKARQPATAKPTTMPRITPPAAKPNVSSVADKGGMRESTMLPCTLAMISDDEVLAKAFCAMAMMISPGARNSAKLTPATWRTEPPSARAKTASSSKVVTTGATMVWL